MVEEETRDMRLSLNLQKHTLASIHYRRGRLHKVPIFVLRDEIKVSYRRFILKGFPSFRSTTLFVSLNTVGVYTVSGIYIWKAGRYFALTRECESF